MEKQYLALLIEAKYPSEVAKKISSFATLKSETLKNSHIAGDLFSTSTKDTEALAQLIIAYLNQKHNANISPEELETFTDQMLASIKRHEEKIKVYRKNQPER